MRFVKQKHKNGCVIAALAMLTNLSYDHILKIAYPNRISGDELPGLSWEKDINSILQKINLELEIKAIHPKKMKLEKITSPSLIVYFYENHAAVWNPETQEIWDPARGPIKNTKTYQETAFCYILFNHKLRN